jgi:UDP-2,3-diacylglucosamine pyrophosphatase LpxH
VFEALGRHLADGHLLTILIGNHDVELALPPIQDALLTYLGATIHQVHFVDNNRAYRIGRLLIEHGNRYDGANENDWTGLRAISSALSRGEAPRDTLEASAGSRLVEKIISPLKAAGYPFIDLLQPQGELVALLLVALEPSLILDLPKIARILRAKQLEQKNALGLPPGQTRHVAFTPNARPDDALRTAFGSVYETLHATNEQVSSGDLVLTAWRGRKESLSDLLDRGETIPAKRLEQIRVAMRKLILADKSDHRDGDTEQYGAAARRMIESSKGEIEVVVMGHTHLSRHIGPAERATYINTGTWADVIRVPSTALEKGQEDELQEFLRGLCKGKHRRCLATYADIHVDTNGRVSSARLLPEPVR